MFGTPNNIWITAHLSHEGKLYNALYIIRQILLLLNTGFLYLKYYMCGKMTSNLIF